MKSLNENYQSTLLAKRDELLKKGPDREDIAIERLSDAIDDVQHAASLDLAIASLNRNWQTVRQIDEALQRISEGTYGVCENCDEPISEKRLQALPWALLCRNCQEMEDSRQQHLAA